MKKEYEKNIPYWVREHIKENKLTYSNKNDLIVIGITVMQNLTDLANKYDKTTMGYTSWMGDVATIRGWIEKLETRLIK